MKVLDYDGAMITDVEVVDGAVIHLRQFFVHDNEDKVDEVFLTKQNLLDLIEMFEDEMEEVLEFGKIGEWGYELDEDDDVWQQLVKELGEYKEKLDK